MVKWLKFGDNGIPVEAEENLIANREGLTLSKTAAYTLQIAAGRSVTANATGDRRVSVLASAISKTINVAWAVGSGNGGLDAGTISNTTYHIYLIERTDTGVVDVVASTSATAPTLPTNYTYYRRIGAVVVQSAAIRDFDQYGNLFKWRTAARDLDGYSVSTSGELKTLTVPTGVPVEPIGIITPGLPASGGGLGILITDPSQADVAPTMGDPEYGTFDSTVGSAYYGPTTWYSSALQIGKNVTNTSGQLRFRRVGTYSGGTTQTTFQTLGYVDLDLGILSGSSSATGGITSYVFASLPTAAGAGVGALAYVSDVGSGVYLRSTGSVWVSAFVQSIYAGNITVNVVGAATNQATHTLSLPANFLHPNAVLRITMSGGRSAGTAANVTVIARIGASTNLYSNGGANAIQMFQRYLIFQNSLSTQISPNPGNNSTYAVGGANPANLGVNFASAQTLNAALTVAAGDTGSVYSFIVEYLY